MQPRSRGLAGRVVLDDGPRHLSGPATCRETSQMDFPSSPGKLLFQPGTVEGFPRGDFKSKLSFVVLVISGKILGITIAG